MDDKRRQRVRRICDGVGSRHSCIVVQATGLSLWVPVGSTRLMSQMAEATALRVRVTITTMPHDLVCQQAGVKRITTQRIGKRVVPRTGHYSSTLNLYPSNHHTGLSRESCKNKNTSVVRTRST